VLARGNADVSAERAGEQVHLALLHEGAIFGEMALLNSSPRSATVTAQVDCDLLEFDCAALLHASSTLEHLGQALSGFARERLLRNVVSTSPLFSPLDSKQRTDLLERFVTVEAAPDAQVIAQGDVGQGLYIVLRGDVVVTRAEEPTVAIARLSPGELFGEISLLQNEPTTASVHAGSTGASLLFLGRDYFSRLLTAVPELRAYFERLAEERMMDLRLSLAVVDGLPAVYVEAEDEIEVELDA
jgi:CRP-like cAMP-binding protein